MTVFFHIGITSDHAGIIVQKLLVSELQKQKLNIKDFAPSKDLMTSVDYPDYVGPLAKAVSSGHLDAGIALCGTGIGMAITANKYKGVRAVSVWDENVCELSRKHNDANFLCLGTRQLSEEKIFQLVTLWLKTSFEAGRHQARVDKIKAIEHQNFRP